MTSTPRRTLALLAVLVGVASTSNPRQPGAQTRRAKLLLASLAEPADVAALAPLARAACTGDPAALEAELEACLGTQEANPLAAFARATQADFAALRVVQVGGWVLARTEALLLALAPGQPAEPSA